MGQEALVSLAILKVNWDEKGRDYVDNFVPFVVEAISASDADRISVAALQTTLRDRFGLIVPQGALNTLLRRAERQGFLARDAGTFVRRKDSPTTDFASARAEASRRQTALVAKLIAFVKHKADIEWTEEQALEGLLAHLRSYVVPILAAAAEGIPPQPATKQQALNEFLISAFTVHLFERDPEGFSFLDTVAKGNMLATSLFLPDIGKVEKKFHNLTAYLDTQLLLRALGLEGDTLRESAAELLELLYASNISLSCFDVTIDEIRRILDAAQYALRDKSSVKRGPFSVYENFINTGARASDVELIIAGLERSLKRLHVQVVARPLHEVALTLNEAGLDALIVEEMPRQSIEARRHDIDCLTAIHRLRQGRAKSEIETCGHIFVTTNNALARAAARYFIVEHERLAVPLCINDHTIATLAWVKNPRLRDNLTYQMLVSDAYAALSPPNELWRKYNAEIEKLQKSGAISVDEYHLLRFSTVARNALMDSTLGSPDAFTEGTVQEVLEVAVAETRREAVNALEVEKQKGTEQGLQLKKVAGVVEAQRQRFTEIASDIGRWARHIAIAAMVVLSMTGVYATLPPGLPEIPTSFQFIVPICILIFVSLTMYSLLSGGTVRSIARSIELVVARFAERALLKMFATNALQAPSIDSELPTSK